MSPMDTRADRIDAKRAGRPLTKGDQLQGQQGHTVSRSRAVFECPQLLPCLIRVLDQRYRSSAVVKPLLQTLNTLLECACPSVLRSHVASWICAVTSLRTLRSCSGLLVYCPAIH